MPASCAPTTGRHLLSIQPGIRPPPDRRSGVRSAPFPRVLRQRHPGPRLRRFLHPEGKRLEVERIQRRSGRKRGLDPGDPSLAGSPPRCFWGRGPASSWGSPTRLLGRRSGRPPKDPSSTCRFRTGRRRVFFLATPHGVFHLDLETGTLEKKEISDDIGAVQSLLYDFPTATLFAGTDSGLFRSRDGGETWLLPPPGLPPVRVNIVGRSAARLFCGTSNGVFVSDRNGDEWVRADGIQPLDVSALSVGARGPNLRVFASDSPFWGTCTPVPTGAIAGKLSIGAAPDHGSRPCICPLRESFSPEPFPRESTSSAIR